MFKYVGKVRGGAEDKDVPHSLDMVVGPERLRQQQNVRVVRQEDRVSQHLLERAHHALHACSITTWVIFRPGSACFVLILRDFYEYRKKSCYESVSVSKCLIIFYYYFCQWFCLCLLLSFSPYICPIPFFLSRQPLPFRSSNITPTSVELVLPGMTSSYTR